MKLSIKTTILYIFNVFKTKEGMGTLGQATPIEKIKVKIKNFNKNPIKNSFTYALTIRYYFLVTHFKYSSKEKCHQLFHKKSFPNYLISLQLQI